MTMYYRWREGGRVRKKHSLHSLVWIATLMQQTAKQTQSDFRTEV